MQISDAEALRLLDARKRVDLREYAKACFQVLEPATPYHHNWHVDIICDHLMALHSGQIKKLIINIPPRFLKSILVNGAYASWVLGHNPRHKILSTSFGENVIIDNCKYAKAMVKSTLFNRLFPETVVGDKSTNKEFSTSLGGYFRGITVGGNITGQGGDLLICDDPHKAIDVYHDVRRTMPLTWFGGSFLSRRNQPKDSKVLLVMQRLHIKDLAGHLKEQGEYEVLELPLVAEKKTTIYFKHLINPSTGKVFKVTRPEGGLLHKERFDQEVVNRLKKEYTPSEFAAQYQQSPIPLDGSLIDITKFKRYRIPPSNFKSITISLDTANKDSEKNAYSVATVWGELDNGYYLLDLWRDKVRISLLEQATINLCEKWQPDSLVIEDKGSGQQLVQHLVDNTTYNIFPIIPKGSKFFRMEQATKTIDAGNVYLPTKAEWLHDFESEMQAYPHSSFADIVDSTSQFLNWIKSYNSSKDYDKVKYEQYDTKFSDI